MLTGRTAVVTGGSRGIGAGIARALAAQGATVVVNGRGRESIDERVAELRETGATAYGVAADVTDPDAVERLRREAAELAGPVSLVVANAGGQGEPADITTMSVEQWRRSVDANLTSAFLTLRAFLPDMVARRRGSVLTVASTAGRLPSPASPAYGAANAGLLMLTRQAAQQVAPHGVRVNAIAPGAIRTERTAALIPPEVERQMIAAHPLGRVGTPDDVARAALFLLSDASEWITGITLDVNGGRLML
jgi:3-oxoacyl-[acyl-carrier protein] reductase